MLVPLSWLRELVAISPTQTGREVADRLIRAGLEVKTVEQVGADLSGPLIVGRVAAFESEQHSNGKTIRWCQVDVGEDLPRGIVCGAANFEEGDSVVVALPGAVLPGGFAIGARKTYGHVSDGMICSPRELGTGEEYDGIWVLPPGLPVGADALELLELRDDVLDIAVTPDRGYGESMRGIAREAAIAFGLPFVDPAGREISPAAGEDWPVVVEDTDGCDRFVTRSVTNLDSAAATPLWMQRRISLAGMRPISLAVDVTNYVMLELGQPLHAYDRNRLSGAIRVRRARPGESLRTLDGTTRTLTPEDLLITDDSGPIGVAGVMGGAATETSRTSTDLVIEAAHFDADTISQAARRHHLPSEASKRFARGVDTQLQEIAADRAVTLLAELGGATVGRGQTVVDCSPPPTPIELELALPTRLMGLEYEPDEVRSHLAAVGCGVEPSRPGWLTVTPPSWRPDLLLPADLVEEVARVHGYDAIPSILPRAVAGGGLTQSQRLRRRIGFALAGAGYVEVLNYPFASPVVHDELGLLPDDPRRDALRLANPLSDEEPELRTSLLPGLLGTLRRNAGRGFDDLALFEVGLVFRPDGERSAAPTEPPRPSVLRRPTDEELSRLDSLLPRQPRRVAVVLTGHREPSGWWGDGRRATWSDAVEAAQIVALAAGVDLDVSADEHEPWHPGRCAALKVAGELAGHAGELHPGVLARLGLPARTCAMELELDVLERHAEQAVDTGVQVSPYPPAKEDVSLVVAADVPAEQVRRALAEGGGDLLESVQLFDVFEGDQIGPGKRSLAFALRFRAADRTLTTEETVAARERAVALAHRQTGATQRA